MNRPAASMTNYRWTICIMLFFATTINYLDRQVLSLTWKNFIAPEFHWTNSDYGNVAGIFSIVYALGMLFAGRFVDKVDTKKGYIWAIGIWSAGACIHAFCGVATSGIVAGQWFVGFEGARRVIETVQSTATVASVSVMLFIIARVVLAVGEAGNFPAAVKATAEYFPKKDRALATSIFNAGATVGALAAPLTIPIIASLYGWEMAFILIGVLGFIWIIFWILLYRKPDKNHRVSSAELEYINQDDSQVQSENTTATEKKLSLWKCLRLRQTWAFAIGKFMTDGVWWFLLFWAPAYIYDVYGYASDSKMGILLIFILYTITLLSIIGGWLPKYFVEKLRMNPYAGRMRAMLIFAFFPLLTLLAQPLGSYSVWFPVVIIGIAGAAHQAWSANMYCTVSDMFPKNGVATITGFGGMAGGVSAFLINIGSGRLFDFAERTNMTFMGFEGISAGYFIIFIMCSVAYLIGWSIMKLLVPRYKPV